MGPSKLRRAIGAVKDKTSIGLAKVGSSSSLGDLEVAIVKATRHDEYPAEEKHVREILSLTCYSRAYVSACVSTISKRLSKTKSWTVALKSLILIQRLLSDGDPAYEQEIFFSTRRGTRLLNMSDFRDRSYSSSWDFSAFVRTYALYLDERLEYKMQNRRGRRSRFGFDEDDEQRQRDKDRDRERYIYRDKDKDKDKDKDLDIKVSTKATPLNDFRTELLFSKMQHLQLLLERFIACRPTGVAKTHRIVIVALYPIVKESFQIYHDMTEIMSILIDRFAEEMEVQECSKVYDVFCRVGKQYDELDMFYTWSKSIGIGRAFEYPDLEKVTAKKLELMDNYIREKSRIAKCRKLEQQEHQSEDEKAEEPEPQEDMNAIKALPPPEEVKEEPVEETKEAEPKNEEPEQTEGDLLNLGDDTVTTHEYGDKLALALFDGAAPATNSDTKALPWHAFDDSADWETALVQSASNLSNQKPSLGGGFDTLLLDGMYQHGAAYSAMQGPGYGVSGSNSSVALGSAGRPAMLALPAPPSPAGGLTSFGADPFAASLAVAPPHYVQMSEIEKKQRLLMEEQLMWQQYANRGMQMQGQVAYPNVQANNTYMGGYQQNYWGYSH
ncbi:hypothetical protein HN51_038092 [Arachis hypogaea]|uniref:ENTH domain-containing protein n=1 Tax=Arachis hypogaea TaxID=3818 RepID=A0A444ZTE6_ARAHY|nr:putative clathrin assembly protein At1g03050 [Arachis hypogaea]QHO03750.1 Putative clathrin assembly protein [Arachis hypogaea]RYR17436.1 hypothetical protein Ahy_B03g062187 [Arachis hypogaea]